MFEATLRVPLGDSRFDVEEKALGACWTATGRRLERIKSNLKSGCSMFEVTLRVPLGDSRFDIEEKALGACWTAYGRRLEKMKSNLKRKLKKT